MRRAVSEDAVSAALAVVAELSKVVFLPHIHPTYFATSQKSPTFVRQRHPESVILSVQVWLLGLGGRRESSGEAYHSQTAAF